jgi:transcription initiation factor TFIIF subunit alpha
MRSKNKAKAEDGEEGAEDGVEGDHLMTVDHEEELVYVGSYLMYSSIVLASMDPYHAYLVRHRYDEDEAKERKKKRGKHGDVDEMDFDEVWQDDEEMPAEMPGFEDDAKDDVGALKFSFPHRMWLM